MKSFCQMLKNGILLLLYLFIYSTSTLAQESTLVDSIGDILTIHSRSLYGSSAYFVDSTSKRSFQDIIAPDFQDQFIPFTISHKDSFQLSTACEGWSNRGCHTVWSRVHMFNETEKPVQIYYRNYFWRGDYETIFILREDSLTASYKGGFFTPYSQSNPLVKPLSTLDHSLRLYWPILIHPQEKIAVYTKYNHRSTKYINISPRIWSEKEYERWIAHIIFQSQKNIFTQGIYAVLFFLALLYFITTKNISSLFFAAYVLCVALIFIDIESTDVMLFPESPKFSTFLTSFLMTTLSGVYAAFLYYFLDIYKVRGFPKILLKILMYSSIAATILLAILLIVIRSWILNDTVSIYYSIFAISLHVLFLVYTTIKFPKRNFYYILASLVGIIGVTAPLLHWRIHLHPFLESDTDTFQVGMLFHLLFFAFGLGNQILNTVAEKAKLAQDKESRSKLYTNITHEFRTPLTVIMGMTENIKGHEQERSLIKRNSKNLLRLINQLLDLSKLESSKMSLQLVSGNIIDYLQYFTESFQSMASEKEIALEFSSEEKTLEMDFDEVKLQQVMYNLLSNAIKFTPIGGQVSIKVAKDQKNQLSVEIIDTGIGISASDLPNIFDRFYQADQSTTRKAEGTGIGLSFTKEIITLMGGKIKVESQIEEGSTFSIYLPVEQEAVKKWIPNPNQEEAITVASNQVPSTESATADLPHLLLIEDNKDVSLFIGQMLNQHYQITFAANGQEGINSALDNLPDLIISDVMMPKKDGYEVCHTLKTDERTSHIPIILLTAKAEQSDKITGLKHGADAYLMKPFDKEELLVRLEQLLALRRTLQEKYRQIDYSDTSSEPIKEPTLEDLFLEKVRAILEEELNNAELSIPDLCQKLELSNMQFYRKLKGLTGQNPTLFIRSYRLQKAKYLLNTTSLNISEIAYEVGFTDPAYFSRAFKNEYKVPPTEFRK